MLTGKNLPIQCIALQLYDDHDTKREAVQRTQWLDPSFDCSGQHILLVSMGLRRMHAPPPTLVELPGNGQS